eukprot:TRINITY_DN7035_c0_g1_i1.p1 TRINITY_DN7035_c0_g1~~TRINITY_DN7035_c0_g1_i1.p1  ORF type:complete len:203 (+),score=25.80 TRINITY_DN7035_c0_g1_i1:31-639(+)
MERNTTFPLEWSTSLVLMPPPEFWPPFVEIKKNHMNPKIKRPPYPHVTLLAPFVSKHHFEEARQRLTDLLKDVKPFRVNFAKFALFENRGSQTLYLDPVVEPSGALDALHQKLADGFPEVQKESKQGSQFEAHIGVGFFRDSKTAKQLQAKYQKDWKPIDFMVKEIYIVSRLSQESPFEVRVVIPFGNTEPSAPHFEEKRIF